MSDRNNETPAPPSSRVWTTPRLVAYGHIGKLTQGASGMKSETGGMRR
jgi:hypothetical protein